MTASKKVIPGAVLFRPVPVLVLLSLLALLIYSNTFSASFHFDDFPNIADNPQIRDLSNFLDIEGSRYVGFLSFALNYHFGGLNVFGYHLVNLLIHITNGFLVYSLVLLLLRTTIDDQPSTINHQLSSFPMALFAALLFIAHPIQTQAVTYVVQRFASLAALFYLLAVVCYLKWRIGPIRPIGPVYFLASLLSTLLAMKTKENSFTLPFMILLIELVFFRHLTKRRWMTLIPFLLTLLIIPLSYGGVLGEAEGFARDTTDFSRLEYLFTQFRVIVTYLRLLVLPINQNLDYDYPVYHSFFQPAVFASFLFLLGLLGLAVRRVRQVGPVRLIPFGLLWFFLTLSIESSIIPITDVIFEHRVYLPSVGIFMAVSVGCSMVMGAPGKRGISRRWGLIGLVMVIGTLSAATYLRNFVWANPVILWQDVVKKAPGKARGHNNLGIAYADRNYLKEATQAYETALKLKPDYANVYNNLGNIYANQGRLEEAIRLYGKAMELKPDYADATNNLGIAYTKQGHIDEAIEIYRKGLSLQSDLDRTHFNLGNTYGKGGRAKEAIEEYQAAITLNPTQADYHYALGNAYTYVGQPNDAIRAFEAAVRFKPDFTEAHYALGNAYADQDRLKAAMQAYETVLKLKPDHAEAHNNLGTVYMFQGRTEDAVSEYRKALKIKPDYAEAARNLENATKELGK